MQLESETRVEWLQHPVSKEVRKEIAAAIDNHLAVIVEEGTLMDTPEKTNQATVKELGMIGGLKEALSILSQELEIEEEEWSQ